MSVAAIAVLCLFGPVLVLGVLALFVSEGSRGPIQRDSEDETDPTKYGAGIDRGYFKDRPMG